MSPNASESPLLTPVNVVTMPIPMPVNVITMPVPVNGVPVRVSQTVLNVQVNDRGVWGAYGLVPPTNRRFVSHHHPLTIIIDLLDNQFVPAIDGAEMMQRVTDRPTMVYAFFLRPLHYPSPMFSQAYCTSTVINDVFVAVLCHSVIAPVPNGVVFVKWRSTGQIVPHSVVPIQMPTVSAMQAVPILLPTPPASPAMPAMPASPIVLPMPKSLPQPPVLSVPFPILVRSASPSASPVNSPTCTPPESPASSPKTSPKSTVKTVLKSSAKVSSPTTSKSAEKKPKSSHVNINVWAPTDRESTSTVVYPVANQDRPQNTHQSQQDRQEESDFLPYFQLEKLIDQVMSYLQL